MQTAGCSTPDAEHQPDACKEYQIKCILKNVNSLKSRYTLPMECLIPDEIRAGFRITCITASESSPGARNIATES